MAAAAFVAIEPGSRVPSVRELAVEYKAGTGTIHRTLRALEQAGAISLEHHGRNGAYLRRRSIGRLWAAARGEPLTIALPIPTTPLFTGLATAVKALLAESEVECSLAFFRGSLQRLAALRSKRCDVAVTSAFAAEERGSGESIALELPAGSYVAEHRVFFVDRLERADHRIRILTDPDSTDLVQLSQLEFGSVEPVFVPANAMQFARLLAEGNADAVIWNSDSAVGSVFPSFVKDRPLSDQSLERLRGGNTRASFLFRTDDELTGTVLRFCLRPSALVRIQNEVSTGVRSAEF